MAGSQQDRAAAVEAFAAVATPDEKARLALVEQELAPVVRRAQALEVRTRQEAEDATEFLAELARARKKAEDARLFLTKPLRDHVAAINARFAIEAEPVAEADGLVREKVLAFRCEEERRRAAERRRLEAEAAAERRRLEEERRQREAEAQRAREAAAREAAAAEAAARAAEDERRRAMEREADELAIAMRNLADFELVVAAEGDDPLKVGAARTELDARRKAREAQERVAAAARAEEEARALEAAQREAPVPDVVATQVAPAGPVRGASAQASTTKRWTFELEDEARVPRAFLKVDEVAIREAVRRGVREIAGVRIFQQDGLSVRASRR